jgi:hypothetical protein
VDAENKRLTPSHAAKGGKRYRYYVSRSLITDPARTSASSWRLPAVELERLVVRQIGEFLCDQSRIWAQCKEAKLSDRQAVSALKRADNIAKTLLRGPNSAERPLLLHLVKRIMVLADRIVTELSRAGLLEQLSEGEAAESRSKKGESTIVLTVPCQFRRRGSEMRLVLGGQAGDEVKSDATLIAALVRAHTWWSELCSGKAHSIKHVADREDSDARYVARNLKLVFLAPDITAAILEGRQPVHLTADALIKMSDLPYSWALQRRRVSRT